MIRSITDLRRGHDASSLGHDGHGADLRGRRLQVLEARALFLDGVVVAQQTAIARNAFDVARNQNSGPVERQRLVHHCFPAAVPATCMAPTASPSVGRSPWGTFTEVMRWHKRSNAVGSMVCRIESNPSRHEGWSSLALLQPFLLIEASGGRLIEQGVMRPLAHGPRGLCPAGARPPRRLDDKPSRLSVHFDLVWELCLIEEKLREADASRVADLHDAGLGAHVPTP